MGYSMGGCSNRAINAYQGRSHSGSLKLDCALTGSIVLKVTSASGERNSFLQQTATLPISAACGCSSSPSPNPTPSPTAAAIILATDPSPSPASNASTGTLQCASSSLGYACSLPLDAGAVLHWTAGGAAPPQGNNCTRGAVADPSSDSLLHMALESPLSGYASLSFPKTAGLMHPADAVIGRVVSGTAFVSVYNIRSYDLDPALSGAAASWVLHAGVVSTAARGTLLCFSLQAAGAGGTTAATAGAGRRRLAQTTSTGPALDANDLKLNWAINDQTALTTHVAEGGLTLSAITGAAESADGVKLERTLVIVHGALMLAAWVLLQPLGVLAARHRWALGGAPASSNSAASTIFAAPTASPAAKASKPLWFVLHVGAQLMGTACFIAGIVIAGTNLEIDGSSPRPAVAHKALGYTLVGLVGLQLANAAVRPHPGAPRRVAWEALHHWLGRTALAAAWATVGLGIYLAHTEYEYPLAAWVAPAAAVLGLIAVSDTVLTVMRSRRASSSQGSNPGAALKPLTDLER